jgi:hypothetical protein
VGKNKATTTLQPADNHPSGVKSMRFCDGLHAKGHVIFNPGLYIIQNGDLTINDGNLDSTDAVKLETSGATFFFASGGRLKLGGNNVLDLEAPKSGPYSGLVFFGSHTSAAASQKITGTSDSKIQGAIYMPGSDLTFTGNSASNATGCTQVIARTVTFTGDSGLAANCANAGTSTISGEIVSIVE